MSFFLYNCEFVMVCLQFKWVWFGSIDGKVFPFCNSGSAPEFRDFTIFVSVSGIVLMDSVHIKLYHLHTVFLWISLSFLESYVRQNCLDAKPVAWNTSSLYNLLLPELSYCITNSSPVRKKISLPKHAPYKYVICGRTEQRIPPVTLI